MRQNEELRPFGLEKGVQLHASGSCLIKVGRTHVLCAANLEDRVPGWMKGKGSGWLTAEYGMLPSATHTRSDREAARGKQQGRTVEIQRLIGRSLRQAVDLAALGERTLTVDCDVLNADGGTRCAAITGAWVAVALALRSQGLEAALVRQVAAVSAGIVETGEGRRGLVLDLEYEEDHLAAVDCNLVAARPALGGDLELVELQGTGEGRSFSRSEATGLLDLGLAGCAALMEAQRAALE
ncbi:ribonuclease PH [Geothrix limicola]|uniref:Ribonuclease PH n=1 Tax=Geothrix limicola TaxID=2927978 RepID=A0ABQ5QFD2_9BACT|nr:ribonuclease PH [Geothrix limicola]GLH73352.1 ribonuclease PH [Geothrix limicola]